jgi:hypothetical protein
MNIWLLLVIIVPFLFLIGTINNALKAQKKLEEGTLKELLKKREEQKQHAKDKLLQQKYEDDEDEF